MQQEMKLFKNDIEKKIAKDKHQSYKFMIASFPLAKTKLGFIYTGADGVSSIQALLEDETTLVKR